MSEIKDLLIEQGQAFEEFKGRYDSEMKSVKDSVDEVFKKMNRPPMPGAGNLSDQSAETKAFAAFLRSGGAERKGMEIGTDPSGGYMVMPVVKDQIGEILRDKSPLRMLASIETFEIGDTFEEVFSVDSAGATWIDEKGARPETTSPDLKKLSIPAKEIYSNPMLTQRLADDSRFDVIAWLIRQVGKGIAEAESAAFITGTGVLSPRGILDYSTTSTADDTRSWGTLEHVVTGAAADFAATDPGDALIDLMGSLKTGYKSNAVWLMNRSTAGTIRKFKDGQGNYLWQPGYQDSQPDKLLGHAVHLSEDMPDVGANTLPVIFGDFLEGYRIVQKPSMKILLDPYTSKPNIQIYTYMRVGGDVRDFNSLKLLKVST